MGADVVAGASVLDAQGDQGVAEGVGGGIIAGAEAKEAGKEIAAGLVRAEVEVLLKGLPGFAGLEGALFGVFLFGIFGGGAGEQSAEPALEAEGHEIKRVVFLLSQRLGFVEVFYQRQAAERGSFF